MQPYPNEFSTLFQCTPIPHWVYDVITFEILEVNAAALKRYGCSREEFLRKKMPELWLSEDIPEKYRHRLRFAGREAMLICESDQPHPNKAADLLEEALTLAKIGGWEIDFNKQSIYWSDMVHMLHGTDPATYQPNLAGGIEFYRNDFREMVQRTIEVTRATGAAFDFEAILVTTQKKESWVRVTGRGEMQDGRCIRIIGSFQDIHDRKKAEKELLRAAEDRAKILESIGDAFFTMDRNFVVTYWNRTAEELLQVKREQVLHQNLWAVFPDAVSLPSYGFYHQVLETGQAVRFEDYYGAWLEVNAYPAEDGISVFFRDISLRKEADARLQKAYEERNTILESIGDAFFAVDKNWIVTYWNQMAEKVLFKKREEIVGRHLWTEYADAIDSDFYRMYHTARETGETVSFEEYYPTQRIWFEVTAYPSETGLSVYFKDITLRKEADLRLRDARDQLKQLNRDLKIKLRELEQANEDLEQFAFIASHDLQEPLRMVTSFMDQLRRKFGDELDPKAQEYIHYAVDGARRMKRIILDLLEYSRAGRINGQLEEIELEEIVLEYMHLRKQLLEEKAAGLQYEKLPVIRGNRAAITQTLHALLDNAVKYSKQGVKPEIRLSATETQEEWIIEVRDNGIGIDPGFHDKIFIIFQRLHNRDAYEGTGIGLSIVKKHVETWGGRIWLSSAPGIGSSFYFTIKK